jgi:hypothetical protein
MFNLKYAFQTLDKENENFALDTVKHLMISQDEAVPDMSTNGENSTFFKACGSVYYYKLIKVIYIPKICIRIVNVKLCRK